MAIGDTGGVREGLPSPLPSLLLMPLLIPRLIPGMDGDMEDTMDMEDGDMEDGDTRTATEDTGDVREGLPMLMPMLIPGTMEAMATMAVATTEDIMVVDMEDT